MLLMSELSLNPDWGITMEILCHVLTHRALYCPRDSHAGGSESPSAIVVRIPLLKSYYKSPRMLIISISVFH